MSGTPLMSWTIRTDIHTDEEPIHRFMESNKYCIEYQPFIEDYIFYLLLVQILSQIINQFVSGLHASYGAKAYNDHRLACSFVGIFCKFLLLELVTNNLQADTSPSTYHIPPSTAHNLVHPSPHNAQSHKLPLWTQNAPCSQCKLLSRTSYSPASSASTLCPHSSSNRTHRQCIRTRCRWHRPRSHSGCHSGGREDSRPHTRDHSAVGSLGWGWRCRGCWSDCGLANTVHRWF